MPEETETQGIIKVLSDVLRRGKASSSLIAALVVLVPGTAQADARSEYQQSLQEIADKIGDISRNLNANRVLLKSEQDRLASVEQNIVSLQREMRATGQQIAAQEQAVQALEEKISELEANHKSDLQSLATLVRQQYMQGKPNYLQMLLNQQDPYAVGRLANYYRYFAGAQRARLEEIQAMMVEVTALREQELGLTAELDAQRQTQQAQKSRLQSARQQRQQSVDKLNAKVDASSEKIKKLQQDRQRLNRLLEQIAAQAAEMKRLEQEHLDEQQRQREAGQQPTGQAVIRPLVAGGFLKQRGRLQYPVSGRPKYRFGSRIAESGMRADGTFIPTRGSVPVRSIFRGRVLFADYLKGYGLLLIIDHGDDHISLYGHNESINRRVGDMVETGEVVANSGTSGGLRSHGLYFEIRRNAAPVDPAVWCQ